jgi:ABC-type multidrug transport system fused ATPase/permease subunit
MEKKYYLNTIDDCERCIITKCMTLDSMFYSNANIIGAIIITVKAIYVWSFIIGTIILWFNKGFNSIWVLLTPFIIGLVAGYFIYNYFKYTYYNNYMHTKTDLVNRLIDECKELQETDFDDNQRKQILERLANRAGIEVDWDKAK